MKFFLTGIHFDNPRLTRDWRIWLQYLCWCIKHWMMFHKPYLPMFVRGWAYRHYGNERFHQSWRMREWWRDGLGADVSKIAKPLPWPLCETAEGPFVRPWSRVERFFSNHTGGRSHRCEFTDREMGALYGGQQGAFMDRFFEQFIGNISNSD